MTDTSFTGPSRTFPFEVVERWAGMMRDLVIVPQMTWEVREFVLEPQRSRLRRAREQRLRGV